MQTGAANPFMQLRTWLYIKDIAKYGKTALELKGEMTLDEVIADDRTYYAIERLLFIVGEAVNSAVTRESEVQDLLSNTTQIRRFRNMLAHGYFKVEREQVCKILFNDLCILVSEAEAIPEPPDDNL
jgi:uncharacterized protein with HEPN domain